MQRSVKNQILKALWFRGIFNLLPHTVAKIHRKKKIAEKKNTFMRQMGKKWCHIQKVQNSFNSQISEVNVFTPSGICSSLCNFVWLFVLFAKPASVDALKTLPLSVSFVFLFSHAADVLCYWSNQRAYSCASTNLIFCFLVQLAFFLKISNVCARFAR